MPGDNVRKGQFFRVGRPYCAASDRRNSRRHGADSSSRRKRFGLDIPLLLDPRALRREVAVSLVSLSRGYDQGRAGRFVSRAIIRTRSLLFGAGLVFAGLVALTGWMSWDAHESTFQHA